MKKKCIKILMIISLLVTTVLSNITVFADGTAKYSLTGPNTVGNGSNITITAYLSDLNGVPGGVSSVAATFVYDSTYLEFVSFNKETSNPISCTKGSSNMKVACMMGLDAVTITGNQNLYSLTFKAIKEGTTEISTSNQKITDKNSKTVSTTYNNKTITIGEATTAPAPKSNNANLSALGVTGYSLSPAFAANTTSYTVTVPAGTNSVTITGTKEDSKASVSGLGNVNLSGNTTTKTVTVTAEDGTKKNYTITINREAATPPSSNSSSTEPPTTPTPTTKSNDANLKNLGASGYDLSPAFDKDTLTYEVYVPNTATYVTLTGEKSNSKAKVDGLGDVTLTGDETTQTIKVTAEDGTEKIYTVVIKKTEPAPVKNNDASLKALNVGGYDLNPGFNPNTTNYSINVGSDITSLNLEAIANAETSTVSISGNKNFKTGLNTVTIKVVAEDGTTKNYVINVNKAGATSGGSKTTTTAKKKSSDTSLKDLIIGSAHEISPKFSNSVDTYNITVPYSVDHLELNPILNDVNGKYKVYGNSNFKVGEVNVVTIDITAEDGSKRIITLNVTRTTDKDETALDDIIINGGTLQPSFKPDILDYTVEVGPNVKDLDVLTKSSFPDSKVEIIGNKGLKTGENTVLVKVTDKNGYTKYYTIKVNKKAKTILGLSPLQFAIVASIIGLLLLSLLLLLLWKRKKKDEPAPVVAVNNDPKNPTSPVIEFKPEFNFGSKNGTDDDVVYSGGVLNQTGDTTYQLDNKEQVEEARLIDKTDAKEIPYDMYDEVVTKDELIDAIQEGMETKNPEKLEMLLEQEKLNRKKEEMRNREERMKDNYR